MLEQLRQGRLQGAQRLNLECGLKEFPEEIFDLADSLEILDLSGNALSSLPEHLPRLHRLRVLFCSNNLFTELPAVLGQCPALQMIGFKANRITRVPPASLPATLRWLILTDNAIEALPDEIGQCQNLQKLMLSGNRLRALPDALSRCGALELVRIAANDLPAFPEGVLSLPRLSWLAFAGNPFCASHESAALATTDISTVRWDQLRVRHVLGEGASGVIYQAERCDEPASQANRHVAVKLFKGAVTSDGLPQCEMAACMAAGMHPHLIPAQARITDHPDGAMGLLMPLVDPRFSPLAGPPSLESCTRDVYPEMQTFTAESLFAIACGIGAATAHLHQRGILHGDLYGHNILHDGLGNAHLGDFGAASFFGSASPYAEALQRIEVRAFGCLLEELLERCDAEGANLAVIKHLANMKAECLHETLSHRPSLSDIAQRLTALAESQVLANAV